MTDSRHAAADGRAALRAAIATATAHEQAYEIRCTLSMLHLVAREHVADDAVVRAAAAAQQAFRLVAGPAGPSTDADRARAALIMLSMLAQAFAGTQTGAALEVAHNAFVREVNQ